MLIIKNDGTLYPLNLKLLQESETELLAPAKGYTEEIPGVDGELDFGTELGSGSMELRCISPEGLSKAEKGKFRIDLAARLDRLRDSGMLTWESNPGKALHVWLEGSPEIEDFINIFEIRIPIRYQPVWVSTGEKIFTGGGTLTNEGSVEAPVVVTIQGPVISPSVMVGGSTLSYEGSLAPGDTLVIDTENMTVRFNGYNALAHYAGGFPKLQPGDTAVTPAASGITAFTWRDRWI